MSDFTHLVVVFCVLALLTVLGLIGTIVTSPVLGLFALVFLAASVAVLFELRNLR